MRIHDVNVEVMEVPFRRRIVTTTATWELRRLALIHVRTDDGLEGVGEAATEAPDALPAGAGPILTDGLTRTLAGLDPADDEAVDARLAVIDAWPEVGRAVRSAVETAIVDLLARAADRSVAAWLAPRPRARIDVNALVGAREPAEAAREASSLADAGFGCLKLKGGGEELGATIARVAAVRAAVGSRVDLRLDVNGAWDLPAATQALRALAPFDLEYVEQPLAAGTPPDAVAGLRWAADVPIAADEAVSGVGTARFLVANGAIDVLVLKVARVGGLRQAWAIAELATAAGVPVVVSTLFESGAGVAAALQLAAALPGEQRPHGLATGDLLASDLLTEPLEARGGRMAVPDGVGLGIHLDEAAIDWYRVS